MTVAPQKYTREVHAAQAFFSRLRGQARLIRIGDYRRMKPFNNNVTPTKQAWSDETYFDDGSGWAEYPVPPFGVVARAASRGDSFIVLGGLPASKTALLLRSDTVELRANGVWTSTPNFYEFQVDGNTNADGEMGVEIWPPLRQGFAVGDMAVFDHPMTVMQCIDDDQGFGTNSFPKLTTRSFSLVEAIP